MRCNFEGSPNQGDKMKKMLFLLFILMFLGCEEETLAVLIDCSINEDGEEECIAECPEGYYFQENEDGEEECIECDEENCN